MSSAIDGTAIDKVLRDAVDSGGVPHVAAIAANRDGVIYQGAAGPRAVGENDPVDRGHAVPDHVDDQDAVHRGRAAAG